MRSTHATPAPPTTLDPPPGRHAGRARRVRRFVGGFYLTMAGVHLGIVVADTGFYRHFADGAVLGFVRDGWHDVFMAHPAVWGLAMMAGELTIGLLLLSRGRLRVRVGWSAVVAFQVLLVLFGWGFMTWSVPALAVVVPAALADWAQPGSDQAPVS